MRKIMKRLKLTVNEEKTRLCRVPDEHLTSWVIRLGVATPKRGRAYLGTRPSKKSVKRLIEAASRRIGERSCSMPTRW